MEQKIVKFLRRRPPYMEGDIAGFPTDRAELLVKAGVCAYVGDGTPKPKKGKEAPKSRRKVVDASEDSGGYTTK